MKPDWQMYVEGLFLSPVNWSLFREQGLSLFHQFSGCVTLLISIAQSWHVRWSGELGCRHGGCTVSSILCFAVRSVKGTMCPFHKHLSKVCTVTTGCISFCMPHTDIWYSLSKGYSTGGNWAPGMRMQPKRGRGVDLDMCSGRPT